MLACYVLDQRLTAASGPRRLQFLYDSLRELRAALDGRLLVTRGRPEKRIPFNVREVGASSVHISADYSRFGRRRDDAVRVAPAASGPAPARWKDPADVARQSNLDIPDPGVEPSIPPGENAARRRWSDFVENQLDRYAADRDRPDLDVTSRMSAYLHFGNIHPRTLAADLDRGKLRTDIPRHVTGCEDTPGAVADVYVSDYISGSPTPIRVCQRPAWRQ